ncbi:MAG TPA: twin-arginine translocase TatA/TatE family subunit [Dehalococcoidia bacterium]|nr:twin-arginine translocase TatA/TatE family subunit [Dehalococcoidia bacterium]
MGSFSIWHWLVVLAVVLLLFGGGGKISKIMGDMAKGVKSFKKGLKEEDEEEVADTAPPVLKSNEESVVDSGARKDEAAKT